MFKARRSHIETRREFERNLNLLRENISQKKISFSDSLTNKRRLITDLTRMRALPNRRFDFNTVNESARLLANSMDQMPYKNDE